MNQSLARPWSDRLRSQRAIAATAALLCLPILGQDRDEKEDENEEEIYQLSPFTVEASADVGYRATSTLAGTRINTNLADIGSAISIVTAEFLSDLGATVGGAQDINLMRHLVAEGYIPPAAAFTPEGLFSQHDLPLDGKAQPGHLIDIVAQATRFSSPDQPATEALVQLGFTSGIDAATFKPKPLNLVAVVDRSGSMSGKPIELVRQSLLQVVSQLGREDQLSIVLYGHSTHIHLPPTRVTISARDSITKSIQQISSSGSTYMEAGLKLGYALARQTADGFPGATRVMLFTDEQPNVGRSDPESFAAMAEEAALDGIGLTTIGVGAHFGAELAEKISSVRGGNLFFFPDLDTMQETFRKDFDTMALELAHNLVLTIAPRPGIAITGLYGIPGDAVSWGDDGSLTLRIATIFASRNKGAIFFGLGTAPNRPSLAAAQPKDPLATVSISYIQADNDAERRSTIDVALAHPRDIQPGLAKGAFLVEQYAAMRLATQLVEADCHQDAYQTLARFARRQIPFDDEALEREKELVSDLADLVWAECETRDLDPETAPADLRPTPKGLPGEWRQIPLRSAQAHADCEILRFTPKGQVEIYFSTRDDPLRFVAETSYSIENRSLVFGEQRRSFTYRLDGDTLLLKEGRRSTLYRRQSEPLAESRAVLLHRLQHEVSGLPAQRIEPSMLSDAR